MGSSHHFFPLFHLQEVLLQHSYPELFDREELEGQLHEKKVDTLFTDKLKAWLAKKGFDPLMGARPMQRLIQDTIRRALADELLFGRLTDGGRLTVDLESKVGEDGKETQEVKLDILPLPKKEGKAKPEEATAG